MLCSIFFSQGLSCSYICSWKQVNVADFFELFYVISLHV